MEYFQFKLTAEIRHFVEKLTFYLRSFYFILLQLIIK